MPDAIKNIHQLVKHLGGRAAAGRALGHPSYIISNWLISGHIPPRYYLLHIQRLRALKLDAYVSERVWGFD